MSFLSPRVVYGICLAVRDKVEALSEQLLMERGGPLSGPTSSGGRHLRSLQQLAQDSVETADGASQSTKGGTSSSSKTKQGKCIGLREFEIFSSYLIRSRRGRSTRLKGQRKWE